MLLPFLTPPAPTTKRRIGNDQCGVLEVEVKGGLTVGEAATINELLANEQSSFVRGAQIADAISQAEGITLSEAFAIIEDAIAGAPQEDAANAIRVKHAALIEEVARVYAKAGQRNLEATVTALIRYRCERPQWSLDDTRKLHKVLFDGFWQLAQDETAAENNPHTPHSEEELGKQPQEPGKSRRRNGNP